MVLILRKEVIPALTESTVVRIMTSPQVSVAIITHKTPMLLANKALSFSRLLIAAFHTIIQGNKAMRISTDPEKADTAMFSRIMTIRRQHFPGASPFQRRGGGQHWTQCAVAFVANTRFTMMMVAHRRRVKNRLVAEIRRRVIAKESLLQHAARMEKKPAM